MVSPSIYDLSVSQYNDTVFRNTCYNSCAIIFFSLLQSSCYLFYVNCRLICYIQFTGMSGLNRNKKVFCENCGTQTKKRNIVRHKTSCSVGTFFCTESPNISITSQANFNYHIPTNIQEHEKRKTYNCKICVEEFSGFHVRRKHSQHGFLMKTSNLSILLWILS